MSSVSCAPDTPTKLSAESCVEQVRKTHKYGLSNLALDSATKDLSIKDQAPPSATSVAASASSVGSSEGEAPSFTEPAPSSEKSAGQDGGSKGSSRTSSAEHSLHPLDSSDPEEEDDSHAHAEVVSLTNCTFSNNLAYE